MRIDENKFFYLVKIQKLDLGAVRTKDTMSSDSDNYIIKYLCLIQNSDLY